MARLLTPRRGDWSCLRRPRRATSQGQWWGSSRWIVLYSSSKIIVILSRFYWTTMTISCSMEQMGRTYWWMGMGVHQSRLRSLTIRRSRKILTISLGRGSRLRRTICHLTERSLKLCILWRLDNRIPPTQPVISQGISWAAWMILSRSLTWRLRTSV